MRRVALIRVGTSEAGTFGVLVEQGIAFLLTLEDPWKENQENLSCIPAGTYRCRRIISPHFGEVFEIMGVPDRIHILIHWGNLPKDTLGCVLVGTSFDPVSGMDGIANSQTAFKELMARFQAVQEFELVVSWHSGPV